MIEIQNFAFLNLITIFDFVIGIFKISSEFGKLVGNHSNPNWSNITNKILWYARKTYKKITSGETKPKKRKLVISSLSLLAMYSFLFECYRSRDNMCTGTKRERGRERERESEDTRGPRLATWDKGGKSRGTRHARGEFQRVFGGALA